MRVWKTYATNIGYRYIMKEAVLSNASWWLLKTKITSQKSGIIYRFKCNRVDCDEGYIGESSRTYGERFKEHLNAPSPIHDHYNITGHSTTIENNSIVGREDPNLIIAMNKAIYIRVNSPSLNKNTGKYHLPHIWDEVLINISELKLK